MAEKFFLYKLTIGIISLASIILFAALPAGAESVPTAPEASPDVYKILAENSQMRVIESIWKPGQRDVFHSHPGNRASIYLTDCKLRVFRSDGTKLDVSPKAGKARVVSSKPVASHSVQNTGNEICKVMIVEMK